MHASQKPIVQSLLKKYVETFKSQAQAVNNLRDVSEATVINVLKGKFDNISNDMWRKIAKQVGFSAKGVWNVVPTTALNDLTKLLDNSKEYSSVYAVTAPAGSGKTQAAMLYKKNNTNVFHVCCAEYYNRKIFLGKILEAMGVTERASVNDMMEMIISKILKMDSPILILDEADKLNDQVMHFFITLYNVLESKCGIVLMATNYLIKRIEKGRQLRRKGYEEIYSRIGRKFIILHETTKEEIIQICIANGITEPEDIALIYNESENDLRRVERGIHKLKMLA